MSRVILPLVLTLATVTVAVLVRARERGRVAPQSATETSQGPASPRPLILQEGDGEHLVRRTGPTAAGHSPSSSMAKTVKRRIFSFYRHHGTGADYPFS